MAPVVFEEVEVVKPLDGGQLVRRVVVVLPFAHDELAKVARRGVGKVVETAWFPPVVLGA